MKRYLIFLITILTVGGIKATDTVRVEKFAVTKPVTVFSPLIIDSIDVENKRYEEKSLLETVINLNSVLESKDVIKAGKNGFAEHKTNSGDKAIQLLTFAIDPDRYCKATLEITSSNLMEIYVDGKKEKTVEKAGDSIENIKPVSVELTLEPRRYNVVMKRINVPGVNSVKAAVIPAKADSAAQITVSVTTPRRVTINDIIEGRRMTPNSAISPTGKFYISGYSEVFPDGKRNTTNELRETSTNKIISILPNDFSCKWVSGEDKLIFTRQAQKGYNLFSMTVPDLEETLLAENIETNSFRMSPNGQFIIYNKHESIPQDKGDLKRTLSPSDRSGSFRSRGSVYIYRLDTKITQRLTFGRTSVVLNDISPDNTKILIMKHQEVIQKRPFTQNTLYEVNLNTLKQDSLFSDPFISHAIYSPDSRQILVTGGGEAFNSVGLNIKADQTSNAYDKQVFIADIRTRSINPVTKYFNPSIKAANWSKYNNQIYLTVEDKDRVQVYSLNPKTGEYQKLSLMEDVIRNFSLAELAPIAIYQGAGTNNSYRLYSINIETGKSIRIADPYSKRLEELKLSPVKDWNFTAAEGDTIQGFYYLPYGFDETRKYPLIVYYYGGTSPTQRTFESNYPLQVYAALGYVVYTLQPSGATGFGQEFAARHVNAWGIKTAQEIIHGTQQFCREHNFIDSTKIGCIGASYGGFMTQYLQTQTQIFAAAVSHAGISDITSYWGEGYWGYAYSSTASANSYPWNNTNMYIKQSPLFMADKINTPLLLLHGAADTNVPPGESIQMFNALRILGKNVELITVDGENHQIAAPEKRIAWNKTIYAWFERWLKNRPQWWDTLYPER
jgi:dipeptidyl aminopeptidase/acylaminoacyl peptidase